MCVCFGEKYNFCDFFAVATPSQGRISMDWQLITISKAEIVQLLFKLPASKHARIFLISPTPAEVEMIQRILKQNLDAAVTLVVIHSTCQNVAANVSDSVVNFHQTWGKAVANLASHVYYGKRIEVAGKHSDLNRKACWKDQFDGPPVTDHVIPYLFAVSPLCGEPRTFSYALASGFCQKNNLRSNIKKTTS